MTCTEACKQSRFIDGDSCKSNCPLLAYNKFCFPECPLKTYVKGNKCLDCKPTCASCDEIECFSCEPSNYLANGTCTSSCQIPLLKDTINLRCILKCPIPLVQFIDQCLFSCPESYYLHQQLCVKDCPIASTPIGSLCVACQERCLQCTSENFCIKCDKNYFDYDGVCVVSCPILKPFHEESNWKCWASCPPNTKASGRYCIAFCPELIDQNTCVSECSEGYYPNELKVCSPCKSECKSCKSAEICTSCNANYFLYEERCQNFCPYIMDTTKWECSDSCNALLYGMICSKLCPLQTLLLENSCVKNCPSGFYES